jgi:hypothetical protein
VIAGLAASALAIAAASLIGKRYGKAIEKSAGVAVRRSEGAIRTAGPDHCTARISEIRALVQGLVHERLNQGEHVFDAVT